MEEQNLYYYKINVSYEIPYNVFDTQEIEVIKARDEIYEKLTKIIPEKYEKFSIKVTLHQLKDNFNYLLNYTAFFRSIQGLPMEEYVSARDIKRQIEEEIETFFKAIDIEYRKINIITLA